MDSTARLYEAVHDQVFNRFSRHLAGWLPGFGVIELTGHKPGVEYRTPMNVFRDGSDRIFALTYGSDVQWLKNVIAAGECRLVTRRNWIELGQSTGSSRLKASADAVPGPAIPGLMRVSVDISRRVAARSGGEGSVLFGVCLRFGALGALADLIRESAHQPAQQVVQPLSLRFAEHRRNE